MSQENVELVYRAIEAFNRHNFDAMLVFLDPDIEYGSRLVQMEGGGPYRGHDGMRKWWKDLFAVFPDFHADIKEVKDLGDLTLARVRQHTQGTERHAPADQTQWHLCEWRGGSIIRWHVFLSEAEALEAAGLRE
jgi:ketosteroid isomerase-like protein